MLSEVDGTAFSYTVSELTPYTEYTFKVEACNNIGCVNSTASTGRTLSAAPEGMAAPDVDGYNSTAMEIRWKEPASPNGPTPIYTVQKTNIAISYPASFVPGTRFSGGGYYTFPAETLPQNVDFTGIRFRFRLREARGLLMFAASENMDEFIAVVFTGGRPRFMYDTSGCPVSVEINVVENDLNTTFDDGEVHTLQVRRNGTSASILVDGIYRGDGSPDDSACQLKQIIGRMTALYVGGVPKDLPYQRWKDNNYPLWGTWNNNFQGCIHKIEILKRVSPVEVWEELQWNQAESHELAFLNWQGCPTNLETESASAIHFMGKGYAKITTCKGGDSCLKKLGENDTVIKFRMRTWLHTGNLFFAHGGRGIYMLAYLLQGRLHYVFSDGITTTTVTYDNPQDRLCDGRWRYITLSKRYQEGTLSIESVPVATSGDASRYMRVSLTSDIFLGGIKPDSDMSQFLQENQIFMPAEGFGGCMAKFTIGNVQVDKIEIRDLINVNLDGCPPFHQPDDTCQAGLVTQIYHGADTLAYDTGLLPYTDYIYRVVAENDVGEVTSPWGYGRTREGRPVGVRGPTNVRAISGYMIEVEWNEPQSTSGLLTMTIISAYNLDQPDLPPVQTEISNVDMDASNITDVTPNTNYEIRISACTSGGCTESEEGATVLTPVEAPEEVAAPTAVATATTLNVMWEPPAKPNGNITGYFLYMDGVQVYAGGKQEHLVSDLQVYTAYQFYVRACTIAGCTDGPVVSLSTAQLPPTLVKPPRLQVLGTRSIEVNWEEPEQLNGVLERYLVLVSRLQEERGEVFHNTTDFYPQHVFTDLLAGTTYYISVGACTGGGCAISNASRATTEESSPEGVPAPIVTSPNSSRLTVIWDEPEFPNGQIISYTLFHNGVNVMEGLARVYHVDGLQPYSRHTFRVQACTARGCGTSAETEARTQEEAPQGTVVATARVLDARTVSTEARTQEEAPQGTVVATARVLDARTVSVRFTSPAQPNGLLYFDIFFQGLFYVDPENWNYTTVMSRRSLRRETAAYTDYTVSQLIPSSEYRIQVVASNTKGSITSNTVPIELYPGSPDGMKPPTVVSDTPTSLQVTWEPVGRVNSADSVAYVVQFRRREGDPISDEIETINFSYRKSGLTAFTSYQFRILATTKRFGAAVSPWVEATTQEDRPTGVDPPRVATVQERSIDLEWSPPRVPNGVLLVYRLYQNQTLIEEIPANETTYTVDQLTPYQVYSFEIEACTVAGCTKSAPSSMVRTLEAVADGIAAPEVRPLTPAIIEVKWTEPAGPNGDITQYMLERRLASGGDITVIATFAPAAAKSYIDDSTALSPFTTYSYRVKVVNGAGAAEGPWANVTTLSSRPGGVLSPALQVLGPTQLEVTWSPPAQPNGVIEYYVIRWAGTQREVRNFTELRVVLDDLVPYTVYSVTVTACTNGGCTESLPASARTDAAVPSGVDPPSATAVSQSAISITWTAPSRPGGPNLRYELSRKKVRQPLESSATDIDIWQTVYQGTLLLYEDRGLPMFTTFVYRVTAFNSVGHLTSNVSAEVTTFGGYPRQAPRVAAVAVSHLEINVNWTLPDPVNLQGDVQRLTLTAQSLQDNVTVYPEVGTDNYTLQDLTANTNYAIRLTVTIFGGAAITSEPVAATTLDGAPEGIDPPVLDVVSDTALRVSWTVPARPNGEIIAYNVIVNGETAPTGSTQPGSLILTELQPYTVYEVQVEVCTAFGCSRSDSVFGTTLEALPMGVAAPTFTSVGPTSLLVEWVAPSRPNGIILRYDLWRKTLRSCSQVSSPAVGPEEGKCTYIECSVFERICGSRCYTGAKVCCDGVLHDIRSGYECCGTAYVLKLTADAVCCAGKFYQPQQNFRCCGTRYIQVLPGEVCCASPTEDRVSVSLGDSCCDGVPYSALGSQICCGGQLLGRYGRLCCGGEAVSDKSVCCGNGTTGQVYLPQNGYVCCGQVYTPTDTSRCCVSDTGHTKVHYYESRLEKEASNEVCCGLETMSAGLSCCNYVGYNAVTQTCADRSTRTSGCGTGVVCPITQLRSALCNRCDFDTTTTVCGSVPGHYVPPTPTPDPDSSCTALEERVYTGLNFSFMEESLLPHTQYEYSVRVVNSAGSTSSPYASVSTLEAPPTSVDPPIARVDPEQLYSEIVRYILLRDGVELFRGLDTEFMDDRNVLPYRLYTYMLTACTDAGCTDSPTVKVATAQGIPEDLLPPGVVVEGPTTVRVVVQPPGRPNGEVLGYTVHVSGLQQTYRVTTPQDVMLEGLTPFTEYGIYVEVCTQVGCANSPNITVTTAEAAPQGMTPPKVVVMNASSVDLYWSPPTSMNGALQAYRILQQDFFGAQAEVYSGKDLTASVVGLGPGRSYSFLVEASTNGGSTQSTATRITMPTRTPFEVPPPDVSVLSATQIFVFWDTVVSPGDTVDQYRVLLNLGQDTEMILGVGSDLNATVEDLKPYTLYEVRLQACLQDVPGGCGTSEAVVKRTFEAPPTGQGPPVLTALASHAVSIRWERPASPNGVITAYRIYQRAEGATDGEILINQVTDVYSFVHSGQDLQPFSVYEYGIMALNSQGPTEIAYASVRTLQAPPEGLPPPLVNTTGAYSIFLAWDPPTQPNGVIARYNIYYRLTTSAANAASSVTVDGNVTSTTISGLEPYSRYLIRLEAVNGAGRVSSTEVAISTKQASPSGLSEFRVEKITTGTAVILRWDPPLKPNGVVTSYRVYETLDVENPIHIGISRVFEFRRLQPYTEYSVLQEACTAAGCTRGKEQTIQTAEIPPEAQSRPTVGMVNATHVLLRWSKPLSPNGRISLYEVFRRLTPLRRKRQAVDTGSTGEVVYRTTDTDADEYEYMDSGLEPYTQYAYKIRASNTQGYTDSPWQTVQTTQAPPEGVLPPTVSLIETEVNSLNVSWTPPNRPNGVLQSYRLQRNTSIPFNPPADGPLFYVDQGLAAYTVYSYTLTVCSGGGCTTSEATVVRTKEAAPLLVSPPTLSALGSTSISATWTEPQISNGEITMYQLSVDGTVVYEGLGVEYTVSNLVPYQEYTFTLTACTRGGCTRSSPVTGRPDDAPPAGLDPPVLRVLGATAIEVSWSPPSSPNGIISSYDVRRDGELVFTDSITQTGTIRTAYTDYNLQPGEEYTYTVIARNQKGSTESGPSTAQTYSSSPAGLDPPTLTPVSSTSIRATWTPPVRPNGQIANYTLYRGNDIVYSGSPDQLTYVVPGLNFFTQYTFRLQACTQRGCELSEPVTATTLEAPPELLAAPSVTALADGNGAHRGVSVAWRAPLRPNGLVLYYQLQRRLVQQTPSGETYDGVILVYNGTNLEVTDSDLRLRPFQMYQYMVIAVNGAGKTSSQWVSVTTRQAPPTSVDPPTIVSTTATTVTVTITPPTEPNGVVRLYNILVDGNIHASGLALQQTVGDGIPLKPFTTYTVQVQACTTGGCTNSTGVSVKTTTAKPAGLQPIQVVSTNSTAVSLSWTFPDRPNGEILRFVVYQRSACPHPEQPFSQTCGVSDSQQIYQGMGLSATAGGLTPYSANEFMLQVENEAGGIDFPEWVRAVTESAAPVYVETPKLKKNSSLAMVNWTGSFVLNGLLEKYVLEVEGETEYEGTATVYGVRRQSKDQVFVFVIRVVTDYGQAQSPPIVFDPNAVDNIGTTGGPATTEASTGEKPFYEEVWFIVVIIIVGLLILFVIAALCLRRSSPKEPYIRERMPLQSRDQKLPRDLFVIDAADGSVIDANLPPSAMSVRSTLYQGPGLGVINPAFANDRDDHLQTLSIGRLSKSSLRGMDEDDTDDITWDRNFDSGLFDDDDVDSLTGPAFSYTREQTVFTDTHL
ncbi:hypothetical protein BaRGS_00003969 [Batillaria attramentaria]|uniref:Uncharacterized protein n=1 Tax=Batillaria attramentaria TaxID=370345 RepID=A0ABD0LZT7_9CAEN